MAVPLNVAYDRYADLTVGLVAKAADVPTTTVNGVALVTWWLSNPSIWMICDNPVATSWSDCAAGITTDWENCIGEPSTVWTECGDA